MLIYLRIRFIFLIKSISIYKEYDTASLLKWFIDEQIEKYRL